MIWVLAGITALLVYNAVLVRRALFDLARVVRLQQRLNYHNKVSLELLEGQVDAINLKVNNR